MLGIAVEIEVEVGEVAGLEADAIGASSTQMYNTARVTGGIALGTSMKWMAYDWATAPPLGYF